MSELNKASAETRKFLKGVLETQATALQGLLDKLPDSLKAPMADLKNKLNAQLESLGMIDAVPAAQEANWAFDQLQRATERLSELASSSMQRLMSLSADLQSKTSAYQSLEADTKDLKKFVPAATAKEMCDTARQEGIDSLMPMIVGMRKQQVELAGLPMPGEDVLKLEQAKFDTAFNGAKTNLKKLAEKGYKLGGRGEGFVKKTAWLETSEFAGEVNAIADIIGTGAPRVEPLLGGGQGGTETKTTETTGGKRLRLA